MSKPIIQVRDLNPKVKLTRVIKSKMQKTQFGGEAAVVSFCLDLLCSKQTARIRLFHWLTNPEIKF